jgi:hypothetical protein
MFLLGSCVFYIILLNGKGNDQVESNNAAAIIDSKKQFAGAAGSSSSSSSGSSEWSAELPFDESIESTWSNRKDWDEVFLEHAAVGK